METPKEPWNFCETPEEKCTMNYCDDNGCQNRKRVLVSEEIPDPTAQLKADKEELLSALEKCWEIIPLDSRKWNDVFLEVDSLIKKYKQ